MVGVTGWWGSQEVRDRVGPGRSETEGAPGVRGHWGAREIRGGPGR